METAMNYQNLLSEIQDFIYNPYRVFYTINVVLLCVIGLLFPNISALVLIIFVLMDCEDEIFGRQYDYPQNKRNSF